MTREEFDKRLGKTQDLTGGKPFDQHPREVAHLCPHERPIWAFLKEWVGLPIVQGMSSRPQVHIMS